VSVQERDRLIARIRQLRRAVTDADERGKTPTSDSRHDELRALEARITHLEALVEGLQDSVHRESTRLGRRIGELEARVDPAALGRALSEDARERGL
jgi:BMFP domain-containing protein YqiC